MRVDTSPAKACESSPALWAGLRAALRGTRADCTRIPLKRAMLLLALPMMLELVLESTFAVVDLFLVAQFGGAGDAAAAMCVLWVANALTLVLDPILIFGLGPIPAMGVEGAAIATNLGRAAGMAMQLRILVRGSEHLRVVRTSLRWHGATMLQIVRASLGGIGQMVIAMTASIFLMRSLARVSTGAVAGATIAMRIKMSRLMPAWRIAWMNMRFTLAVPVGVFVWHGTAPACSPTMRRSSRSAARGSRASPPRASSAAGGWWRCRPSTAPATP